MKLLNTHFVMYDEISIVNGSYSIYCMMEYSNLVTKEYFNKIFIKIF